MKAKMMMAQITVQQKAAQLMHRAKQAICNRRGEGFVDTAVKVLMAVVIGALVLAGLYLLFKDTILPELTRRIQEMFNYQG
ncbi:DUF6133 family protein [Ruminococcaceae bacterium OttesenSCG-928-L11]|nr:DUF6133 family protein [Ruminococcaceae bacterium OttesenSCG-928-L11]